MGRDKTSVSDTIAQSICYDFKHEFIGKVGSGAFKDTYKVIGENNQIKALKVFRHGHSPKRSEREIEAMVMCNHCNIGKLLYVSEYRYDNMLYLFTFEEFLSGGTLSSRLEAGCFSRDEVRFFGEQLIDALTHIAEKDIVHRDIKPDNIMFREDLITPVIVDFGLVRNLLDSSLTQTWLMQGPGSPYFSAPEQLNNEKALIDWRTDQFALGITLSLCCFGIHPYENENEAPIEVVEHISRRDPISARFILKSKETKMSVLTKMVSQWPVQRFRTPEQLMHAWANTFN